MEKYVVTVIELETLNKISLQVEADEAETDENIILITHLLGQVILVYDYNCFSTFQKLRDWLLKLGYGIKCNDSRLNAVQSNMMCSSEKI